MTALPRELAALVDDLRSPDPAVRDEGGYGTLARLAGEGALDAHLVALGDRGVALLGDDAVQARSFGALLLALVVDRDNGTGAASPDAVRRWAGAVPAWYAGEPDTRGWDPALGWLHAVAHGADAVGALAGSPHLGPADLAGLLDLLVDRAMAATSLRWEQGEDDRVALAAMTVLRRDLLDEADVRRCTDRLAGAWRDAAPGPVTAPVDNAVRLARALHLQLVLGVRSEPDGPVTHPAVRDAALRALGSALAEMYWFLGQPA